MKGLKRLTEIYDLDPGFKNIHLAIINIDLTVQTAVSEDGVHRIF